MSAHQSAEPTFSFSAFCLLIGGWLAVLSFSTQTQLPSDSLSRPLITGMVWGGLALFIVGLLTRQTTRTLLTLFQRPFFWRTTLLGFALLFAFLARHSAGNGALAYNALSAVFAWLTAIGLTLVACWRKPSPSSLDWQDVAWMVGLFAFALFLRLTRIETIPTTLSGDEASAAFSALNVLEGRLTNPFTIGWFSFPSLFYFLNSSGIALFGRTILGLRFWATIAGSLTVVAVYATGRTLFGRTLAIFAAIILAGNHFHIHFSRIGLQNVWDGLFTMLAIASLWHGWKSGNRLSFLICGFVLGIGQYFYVTFRAIPIVFLLWSLIAALLDWPRFRQRWWDLCSAAFLALILFLPLGLYFVENPQEFNAPLQRVTIFEGWLDEQAIARQTSKNGVIWSQVQLSAKGIFSEPLQHWYNVGKPLLLPFAAGFFLLGLVLALGFLQLSHLLLLLPLFVVIVAGALSRDAPASQRYLLVAPLVAVIAALPLGELASWIGRNRPSWRNHAYTAALSLTLIILATDLNFYFRRVYPNYTLGGYNTYIAMQLADYLQEQPQQQLYFFGWPRMGYDSIMSVPYLAPHIRYTNVMEPLNSEPTWNLLDPLTSFLFLPERQGELAWVQQRYPGGTVETHLDEHKQPLFYVYQLWNDDSQSP